MIAAQAMAIGSGHRGAYLLTSDGDLLVFREEILRITKGSLGARRPEAAE